MIIKRGIIQMQALNHRINFRERGPQYLCLGDKKLDPRVCPLTPVIPDK